MKTKHVPTLKLCQTFATLCKEKGIVVPETVFFWAECHLNEDEHGKHEKHWLLLFNNTTDNEESRVISDMPESWNFEEFDWGKTLASPLVSEQGEWLPPAIKVKDALAYLKYVPHSDKQTDVIYSKVGWFHQESDHKEANARIKMLNYLLAEGIITTL